MGIFDADIYGPSIPTLLNREKAYLESPADSPNQILPIEYEGIKTMSYGYAGRQQKAVLRGIMATQILMQLLTQTQWGELDYLIFDTPPGTGDIAISLGQEIKYAAAVIVTTPQRLSYIDVIKGIEMWDDLKVPTVSVVENMVGSQI